LQIIVNTFTWWTGEMQDFSVALGILDGDDAWDTSIRLVPQNIQSPYLIALPADGTFATGNFLKRLVVAASIYTRATLVRRSI
jgi:hypothetical protein